MTVQTKINVEELTQNELEDVIVNIAKKYLEKYHFNYNEENGYYEFEVYLDYQDYIEQYTLINLLKEHEGDIDAIREHVHDCYWESVVDEENFVVDEIRKYFYDSDLEYLIEHYEEGYENSFNDFRILMIESNLFYSTIDVDRIINIELPVNIMLENDVAFDHEFSLNDFNTGYNDILEYLESVQEELDEGYTVEEDYSWIVLLKSQGYTMNDYILYCKHYLTDDEYEIKESKFMSSLLNEMLNGALCNSLVCLREMTLFEMEELKQQKEIEIKIGEQLGYVNHLHGGGSVIDIKLEQPFKVKTEDISIKVDGEYGYAISEIYGYIHG